MSNPDSQNRRIVRGKPNNKGWRNLEFSKGENLPINTEIINSETLLSLVHISDLHICDAQSPARAEIIDRFADPHHPMSEVIKLVGTYRAQEILTTQTLEAMIRTINKFEKGITGKPIDAVVVTGDVTDNAQSNELNWYFTLMDGGEIHPDSGNKEKWEGVATTDPKKYDRSYWNPEGTPTGCEDDFPRLYYGMPVIKGLTDAVRRPFTAQGLKFNWLATHGNHDALLQGTVAKDEVLVAFALGDKRVAGIAPETDLSEMFGNFTEVGPTKYSTFEGGEFHEVSPDSNRTFNEPSDWATIHLDCGHDHGLKHENKIQSTKYWFKDIRNIRLISLDTVNSNGGWQGSLDETQFEWLKSTLTSNDPEFFILLSHHPLHTLYNLYAPESADRRVGETELLEELLKHNRIILWLAGHNHKNEIELLGNLDGNGFWHIQTASNIDWPQQGRLVDVIRDGNSIGIVTSVFDHASPIDLDEATRDLEDPVSLAGISRILSANHWQRRSGMFDLKYLEGREEDRNRILWLDKKTLNLSQ
jgi:metallophosphoesterase (TIGR03767 family)